MRPTPTIATLMGPDMPKDPSVSQKPERRLKAGCSLDGCADTGPRGVCTEHSERSNSVPRAARARRTIGRFEAVSLAPAICSPSRWLQLVLSCYTHGQGFMYQTQTKYQARAPGCIPSDFGGSGGRPSKLAAKQPTR